MDKGLTAKESVRSSLIGINNHHAKDTMGTDDFAKSSHAGLKVSPHMLVRKGAPGGSMVGGLPVFGSIRAAISAAGAGQVILVRTKSLSMCLRAQCSDTDRERPHVPIHILLCSCICVRVCVCARV